MKGLDFFEEWNQREDVVGNAGESSVGGDEGEGRENRLELLAEVRGHWLVKVRDGEVAEA